MGTGADGVEVEGDGTLAAEGFDQGVVDDLDDLLAGGDGAEDFLSDGAVADLGDEVADDFEGDVSFQQGEADFAQGFGDVGLVEGAAAAEPVEDAGELVGQGPRTQSATLQSRTRRCASLRGAA